GDVDLAIDSNTRFDLAVAELRMAGTSAGQTLEAMSLDRGPSPQGLNRTLASAFPIKTLRIGAGSLTTVVNTRNNTGQAPGTCEAVYADTLVLEPGSALAVPTCRVYYRTLVNNGGILLDPANVRAISTCRADFDQSGVRDVSDIFAFLSAWFANDPRADLDGNGRNVQDIFSFLSLWFAGC
ncbi:MAG: hypothetical protein K2Q20_04745, partial [Phycisphaerales bacterium]|nr:hypothetical protein [Phycisphaerales bacterium]